MENVKASFDEVSPITKELSVLVEDDFRIDMMSGYQNIKDYWVTSNDDVIKELEQSLPDYIVKLKFIDDTNNIWYPMLAFKHTAVLFPIKTSEDYIWAVSKVEKLKNKEDINTHFVVNLPMKINGKEEAVLFRVDNAPIATFLKNEFELAFDLYNHQEDGESKNQ